MYDLLNDIDKRQLAAVAGPPTKGYLSGYYYQATPGAGLSTSGSVGNGVLRVGKVRIADRVKITKLGAEVTVVGEAASTLRLAVFADSTTTPNYPGDLLLDAGTIPGDAVAVAEVTVSLTIEPGVYWFGLAVQGAATTQPTVRTVSGPMHMADPMPIATTAPTGTQVAMLGYTYSGVTGAIPAAFTTTKNGSTVLPRVFFKTA